MKSRRHSGTQHYANESRLEITYVAYVISSLVSLASTAFVYTLPTVSTNGS